MVLQSALRFLAPRPTNGSRSSPPPWVAAARGVASSVVVLMARRVPRSISAPSSVDGIESAGPLENLAAAWTSNCSRSGAAGGRPFAPHLTTGPDRRRFRSGYERARLLAELAGYVRLAWQADSPRLYKSILGQRPCTIRFVSEAPL